MKNTWQQIGNLKKYRQHKTVNNSWVDQENERFLKFIASGNELNTSYDHPTTSQADAHQFPSGQPVSSQGDQTLISSTLPGQRDDSTGDHNSGLCRHASINIHMMTPGDAGSIPTQTAPLSLTPCCSTRPDIIDPVVNLFEVLDISNPEPIQFQYEDFQNFINSRNPDSASGLDGITYRMIMNLSIENKHKLFDVLNGVWTAGNIPPSWRRIRVQPVPKKKESMDIVNFRPICLLPVLLKCIEGLMKLEMEKYIDKRKLLPDRSYAFRKNYNSTMCINELINVIQYHRGNKHKLVAACLDISKAYDFVDIHTLEVKLRGMGFNGKLIDWIASYLGDRTLSLGHAERKIDGGLAQGSGLSPLLFNLYTADLHELEDDNCYIFQFADDFFILIFDDTWDDAKVRLQSKITDFISHCRSLNLRINLEKTNVTTFGKRGSQVNIIVDNTPMNEVKQIRFLGRIISSNNSIMPHVNEVVEKVNRTSFFLNAISGCSFGIDPRKALIFYKAFVRSKIEYAASSFANITKSAASKLQSTSNSHLRRALGLIRSTPVHVIYHMAGELPIKYRLQLATAKELIKVIQLKLVTSELLSLETKIDTSYNKIFQKFRDILSNLETIGDSGISSSKLKLVADFHHSSKQEMNTEMVGQIFREKYAGLKDKGMEFIFTDGSIGEYHSGGAVYHPGSGIVKRFKISGKLSSMLTELVMIEKAVEFVSAQKFSKVVIFTDSKSGILALDSSRKNQICGRILRAIDDMVSLSNIEIHYIPSHMGIPGNEFVDEAAKRAVREGELLQLKWTREEAIRLIENKIWSEWEREYNDLGRLKGRQYLKIFPNMNTKPWFADKSLNLTPTQIKQLNRIITGHSFSPHSLHRMHVIEDDFCHICNEIEDDSHIIFNCTLYNIQRTDYPLLERYNNITRFLSERGVEDYAILVKFLERIDRKL